MGECEIDKTEKMIGLSIISGGERERERERESERKKERKAKHQWTVQ